MHKEGKTILSFFLKIFMDYIFLLLLSKNVVVLLGSILLHYAEHFMIADTF